MRFIMRIFGRAPHAEERGEHRDIPLLTRPNLTMLYRVIPPCENDSETIMWGWPSYTVSRHLLSSRVGPVMCQP